MSLHCTPEVGCFYQLSKIHHLCCFYIFAHTEATAMIFIRGDIEYPLIFVNIERPLVEALLQRY